MAVGTLEISTEVDAITDTIGLSLAYKELFLSSSRETRVKRAKATFGSAQKNSGAKNITNELLYGSLSYIDLEEPSNFIGLIRIFRINANFRNDFFRKENKQSATSNIEYSLSDISPEFLEILPKEEKSEGRLNSLFQKTSATAKLNIDSSKEELQKKFHTDKDFAYGFFARLDISLMTAEILMDFAKANPGAALGILINPILRPFLLKNLTREDKKCLLDNAINASKQNTKHQHYYRVTFDLLSDDTLLSSLLFSKNPAESLRTQLNALRTRKNNTLTNNNTTVLHIFIEESGSILSTFADQLPDRSSRDETLTEVVNIFNENNFIEKLVTKYQSEKDLNKKSRLKHQIDLLFSKPEISSKLNISLDGLKAISPCGDGDFNALQQSQNNNNLKSYISQNYNAERQIPDSTAFIIVNDPKLWEQLNPAPSILMQVGNFLLGWLFDSLKYNPESEKEKLIKLSPIFEKKLKDQPLVNLEANYKPIDLPIPTDEKAAESDNNSNLASLSQSPTGNMPTRSRSLSEGTPTGPMPTRTRALSEGTPTGPMPARTRALSAGTPTGKMPNLVSTSTPTGKVPNPISISTPTGKMPNPISISTPTGSMPNWVSPSTPTGTKPSLVSTSTPTGSMPNSVSTSTESQDDSLEDSPLKFKDEKGRNSLSLSKQQRPNYKLSRKHIPFSLGTPETVTSDNPIINELMEADKKEKNTDKANTDDQQEKLSGCTIS